MKLALTILSISILILHGCMERNPYVCHCDTSALEYNDSVIEIFKQDTFSNGWRKRSYQMEPLYTANHETYRVLMIYSLTNHSHVYTVENRNEGARIIVQQFTAPEIDKRNNKLDKELIFKLTDKEWKEIKRTIEENCFWSTSLDREVVETLDGGSWFVEGFDPTKRNCANSEFHIDICNYQDENKLGDIVRKIMSYVDQKQLENVL